MPMEVRLIAIEDDFVLQRVLLYEIEGPVDAFERPINVLQ